MAISKIKTKLIVGVLSTSLVTSLLPSYSFAQTSYEKVKFHMNNVMIATSANHFLKKVTTNLFQISEIQLMSQIQTKVLNLEWKLLNPILRKSYYY